MPIGGIVGGLIGAIDGPTIGQMLGGHIGGRSIELSHNGCISPSMHWHVHDAAGGTLSSKAMQRLAPENACLIAASLEPSIL